MSEVKEVDARLYLIENLTKEELIDVILRSGVCNAHLRQHISSGGAHIHCQTCGVVEMTYALSKIDGHVHKAQGKGNEMECYPFDVDYDPEGVIDRVEKLVEVAVPKRASI